LFSVIHSSEMQIRFVGANCVRPLGYAIDRAGEHSSPLQITFIELVYGLTIIWTGDQWSPLQK